MAPDFIQEINDRHQNFLDYVINVERLLRVAIQAAWAYPKTLDLWEAVYKYRQAQGKAVYDDHLSREKEDAPFIASEVEKGFPFYFGASAIAIWAGLEALIEDLLVLCLQNDNQLLVIDAVQKIKVPITYFAELDQEQRCQYILYSLEREIQPRYKQGVSQFESLLSAFGLGGEVDADNRKVLLELCNVRNVLVHRNSIADRRLIETCPWLRLKVGDEVRVTMRMNTGYLISVMVYSALVTRRILLHYDAEVTALDTFLSQSPPLPVDDNA